MAYAIYTRELSKSGWSKFIRHGATEKKSDAIKFAENIKKHSNRKLEYRIREISGKQGYNNPITGESHLPVRKHYRGIE